MTAHEKQDIKCLGSVGAAAGDMIPCRHFLTLLLLVINEATSLVYITISVLSTVQYSTVQYSTVCTVQSVQSVHHRV